MGELTSFDAVAPWYRALETIAFGNALQRSRIACLDDISAPRRVLIVGEGNGRFLCHLLHRYPGIEVDCVDASRRMLELARKRVEQRFGVHANVRWLLRDISSWIAPERHYDLIVTHFFLDCFDDGKLPAVVETIAQAATDDATWLLADFSIPTGRIARRHAMACLNVMYRFFRVIAGIPADRLIDPTSLINGSGFVLTRQYLFRGGLLKSEVWRRSAL